MQTSQIRDRWRSTKDSDLIPSLLAESRRKGTLTEVMSEVCSDMTVDQAYSVLVELSQGKKIDLGWHGSFYELLQRLYPGLKLGSQGAMLRMFAAKQGSVVALAVSYLVEGMTVKQASHQLRQRAYNEDGQAHRIDLTFTPMNGGSAQVSLESLMETLSDYMERVEDHDPFMGVLTCRILDQFLPLFTPDGDSKYVTHVEVQF